MTREDLAKDILLAYIRSQDRAVVEIPFADLAADAVDQANALLEALGAKEAPASWLSKEMRTPAKGFPAIKADWTPKVGEVVWLPSDVQRIYGAEADKGVVLEVLLAGEVCRVAIEHECEEIKIDTKRLRPVE